VFTVVSFTTLTDSWIGKGFSVYSMNDGDFNGVMVSMSCGDGG